MKRGSTLFLKLALLIIGILVLAVGIFGLLSLVDNPVNQDDAYILYPILIGIYVSGIPFFVALYQAYKLISYIDKNHAFSGLSVTALKKIKFCAMTFSGLYVVIWPFLFPIAKLEDAPGLVVFGIVPIFASMVVAIFAAVLQRLLQEAINIKSENDLTV
ncbi:DUF2975 domain-containing protein [Bacillus sp. HNG]|uniref:DUF2975 domain-containing protein n=1 Tax=Bacillus sp. HNG TaxID=2293325 RepID=UPI000E2E582D|nr:DUF2975 domain-containing protein [Bacillus sp. HNG]RFB17179.1 DUF2975 domain-containing protein [Bacillus sp. HNG]